MSSLTEQFSAVTKSQLEAQFKIFNTLASTAVDSAEKVIALNLNTTKASVEKSSAAARKLLDAKDAQELFSLNAAQPTGFDHLLAYGRQLYSIATAAQTELLQSARIGIKQAQDLATSAPLASVASSAPVAKPAPPAPLASVAPVSAAAAAPAPAAKASEPAAAPSLAAAVSAAVATPDSAPVIAEASTASANEAIAVPPPKTAKTPVKPKPAAAPIEPPPAAEIKAEVKPATVKSSFPAPAQKPIALAPESKPSKLKEVAPKGKSTPGKQLDMIGSGKGKK